MITLIIFDRGGAFYDHYTLQHITGYETGISVASEIDINALKDLVTDAQENYFKSQGNKLQHANKSKTVWSLIKTFLNNGLIINSQQKNRFGPQ